MAWIENTGPPALYNLDNATTFSQTTNTIVVHFTDGASSTITFASTADAQAAFASVKDRLGDLIEVP